jgi:hypothetical protein
MTVVCARPVGELLRVVLRVCMCTSMQRWSPGKLYGVSLVFFSSGDCVTGELPGMCRRRAAAFVASAGGLLGVCSWR